MSGYSQVPVDEESSELLVFATPSKFEVSEHVEFGGAGSQVFSLMQTQVKLSPHDPSKHLCLIIDGTSKIGMGFVLKQFLDEKNPSAGVMIIHCGAALLPPGDYSPVEGDSM